MLRNATCPVLDALLGCNDRDNERRTQVRKSHITSPWMVKWDPLPAEDAFVPGIRVGRESEEKRKT